MIVLLIAALAIAALLAGGITIARSHAREQERRDRLHRGRLAAVAAESRAKKSGARPRSRPVTHSPRCCRPSGRPGRGNHRDPCRTSGSPSFSDYPRFPAAVPFQAQDEPAWHRDEMTGGYAPPASGRTGRRSARPAVRPSTRARRPSRSERASSAAHPAEAPEPVPAPAEHSHRRAGPGSHRGGHVKRRRG